MVVVTFYLSHKAHELSRKWTLQSQMERRWHEPWAPADNSVFPEVGWEQPNTYWPLLPSFIMEINPNSANTYFFSPVGSLTDSLPPNQSQVALLQHPSQPNRGLHLFLSLRLAVSPHLLSCLPPLLFSSTFVWFFHTVPLSVSASLTSLMQLVCCFFSLFMNSIVVFLFFSFKSLLLLSYNDPKSETKVWIYWTQQPYWNYYFFLCDFSFCPVLGKNL